MFLSRLFPAVVVVRQAHIVEATSRSTESRAFVHGSELGYCLEKLSERFDERADSLLQRSQEVGT